jgi:hypothetical protein
MNRLWVVGLALLMIAAGAACGDDTGALRQEVAALKATADVTPTTDPRVTERDETIAEVNGSWRSLFYAAASILQLLQCRPTAFFSGCTSDEASARLGDAMDACRGLDKKPPLSRTTAERDRSPSMKRITVTTGSDVTCHMTGYDGVT